MDLTNFVEPETDLYADEVMTLTSSMCSLNVDQVTINNGRKSFARIVTITENLKK